MNGCLFNGIHENASLSSRTTRSAPRVFPANASTYSKMDFCCLDDGLDNNEVHAI